MVLTLVTTAGILLMMYVQRRDASLLRAENGEKQV
jgi:hypothetical protein